MQAKLPGFSLILDLIHVDEYVWKAGTAIYGETDPQRSKWVENQLLEILSSHTDKVTKRSKAGKVFRQVAHFDH